MSTEIPIGDTQAQTRPRVCRRLFPDDEENETGFIDNFRNQFLDKLREDQEAAKLKWNFDFANETPLEGRWEWERIEEETVPSLPVKGGNDVVSQNNQTNTTERSEQAETRTEEQLSSTECRATLH